MSFTESNTVEQMILDAATSLDKVARASGLRGHRQDACATLHEELPAGWVGSLGKEFKPAKWTFVEPARVPRQPGDVMVETWVREALIALNPEIAAHPDRADEVIYALRAILLAVDGDGLVRANENFTQWLRGEKTMPFGPDGEHVPVRLIDFGGHSQDGCATLLGSRNRLTVTNQWTYRKGDTGFQPVTRPPKQGDTGFQPVTSPSHTQNGGAPLERRFDLVFLVNGLPLVIGEAKTPTRSSVTWFDGAHQVNEIYEKEVPAMFVPNVFSFATEGRCLRFGSIRMPIDLWGPWRLESPHPSQTSLPLREGLETEGTLDSVRRDVSSLLRPEVVLDILQHFTLFATDKKHRRIKVICRYQQYETTNKIVARVVAGYPKKGLIWHFQGSGKSLLMVFAAQKLRLHPRLGNPTVLIVVDRIDLDTQITATFNAADVPNMIGVERRDELQRLLRQDVRKVLITTIHKFSEGDPAHPPAQSDTGFQPVTRPPKQGDTGFQPVTHPPQKSAASPFYNPDAPLSKTRRNLPHWKQDGKTYFITFRLADSLPASRRRELERDRAEWTRIHGDVHPSELPPVARDRYFELFHERVQEWLDAGDGSCLLDRPAARKIMAHALRHFDGARYHLGEFVVAGNHVHVLVTPEPGEDLSAILHSWKSFTAKAINKEVGRTGSLWMDETFDHLVRSEAQLRKFEGYIRGHREYGAGEGSVGGHRQDACATLWNARSNIIVMVDEAHRTQEGDLGRKMREALPNAFLFGLTGTPINRADRNTFWAFGADEDVQGYMSRYSFQDSIRDKATLPLHFEAPSVRLQIDKAAIDDAYQEITGDLSEQDRDDLAKRAAKMAVLVKNPERVRAVVEHIVRHYQAKVEPNGFKAQVVVFDRECCVLYKKAMDENIGPEASAIVMSTAPGDPESWRSHNREKDAEERLLDRFRDAADPLKFVIVTSKLLTGFDAPVLQAMYLDKPMRDHNLLQAICRVNRTYGQAKTHGLIVDYIGIFDDVARALDFDEKSVQQVVSNIDELRKALPVHMHKCLVFFPGVDRTVGGYEGLMAAQQHLPDNATRDRFAASYSVLGTIWEALSPDPCLGAYATDYKWLTQVYESVKPVSGNGRMLWHRLGSKTIDLIHQNVHVDAVRDDIETLVLDAEVLDGILKDVHPAKRAREVEIKLVARLRKHAGNPRFKALGERLEKVRERHEQGLLNSLEFLKAILEIARDTVEAEKLVEPETEPDRALAALTELFNEVKGKHTHVIVERIVADIDAIVRQVRFDGWQATAQGEREVKQALRRALLKYKLHTDQDLFDKAYGYIRQHY